MASAPASSNALQQNLISTILRKESFENILGKRENARQSYSEVEYHVVSDTKDATNHHRRYKRNVQVCDPFSRLVGLCLSNGMGQIQSQLVDPTRIPTSNTDAIGNKAKPSVKEEKTQAAIASVQSQVFGLPHLLGQVSNSILPDLVPITPEGIAVKNPVSQIFGQILNEAGQVANQGLSDLGRIVNTPGTNTQPLFEELANVLERQPIAQIGNIDLSPLGILGKGVMVNRKGVPDSQSLGHVIKIKPAKKPMAGKDKRNKPIVNEAGETRSVHLSQSLGRGPAEFPSNGVNVISDPAFLNNPVNLASQLRPILSQSLDTIAADHVLDTHTGVPILLPSKPGKKTKGVEKQIRGTEPIPLPGVNTQAINTVPTNSDVSQPLFNPPIDLIPGDLLQPLGAVPADHVLDTHTGVPMLLPSKPGKKNKGTQKKIRGSTKNKKQSMNEAGQMMPVNLSPSLDLGPDRGTPGGGIVLSGTEILSDPINVVPELGPFLPKAEQIAIQGLNPQQLDKGIQPVLSPVIGDLSPPLGAVPAGHVLDTHTGVPMLLPSKPGKKNDGLKKQIRGTEPVALPGGNTQSIHTVLTNSGVSQPLFNPPIDLIPGDLLQPLGEFPADHVLDTHTGVPMLLPSKPGKKNKGTQKKIRGSTKNKKPSIKEAGQMMPVNLSPSLDLGPDRGTPGGGIVLSGTEILSDPINVVPELGPFLPKAEQIAIQGLNPQQLDKGIQPVLSPLIGDLSPPLGAVPVDHVLDTHTGVPILLPSKMGKKNKGLQRQVKGDAKQNKATMKEAGQMRSVNLSPSLGLDPTVGIPDGGIMLSDPTSLSNPMNVAPALGPILSDAEQLAITGVNAQPFNTGPANYEGRQPGLNPLVDTTSVDLSQPVGSIPADHLLDPRTGVLDTLPLKKGKKNKGRRKPMKGGIKRKKQNFKKAGSMKSVDLSQQFDPGQNGDISNGGILLTDPIIAGNPLELNPLGTSPLNPLDQVLNIQLGVQDTMPLKQRKKNSGPKNPRRGGNKRKKPFIKKVGQTRPIDLSQHLGNGQVEDHVNAGSMISGPTSLDNPMELSLSNTVFLNSEHVAANPAVLSAGDSHNTQNSLTQPIITGPASYEGRQRIIGQPSNVNPIDFAQPLGPVPAEKVWGKRNSSRNPKARRRRRNRMMRKRNRKNRRTNAQRRPVMREVVQMRPVALPQPPRQGSSVEIQTADGLGVHGQPSGPEEIKLLSTKVNVEGSNIQSDVIHQDGQVADHVTGSIDHSVPLKKRKNPRALARQRLRLIQNLRQQNKRRNQQNKRGNQQNRRGNRQNRRGNRPKKGKVKVAKRMETINLSNGEKLPVTQPTTRPPNLDCFTGICIDWSGKKK